MGSNVLNILNKKIMWRKLLLTYAESKGYKMTREEATFYIKELQKAYASMDKKVAEAVDMAIEALRDTQKGEWVLECDGGNECDNLYKCSICGFECGCEEYDKPNFCPNCGCQMIGGGTK
jgi:rubrerythrin